MQNVDIPRAWMIRKLKFFRFLFHVCLFASLVALSFFGGIALFVCLALSLLAYAGFDFVRLSLDYPFE